ncbi:MAG: hypothetical protein ABFR75_06180 [Acidobacteriota bacterium]
MKKGMLFFIAISIIITGGIADEKGITITIPVIPISDKYISEKLESSSLRLSVNGMPREISGLKKIERSLKVKRDVNRSFVLSFITGGTCRNLEKGISSFITNILNTSDFLTIISPLKIYRVRVSANKERIIKNIRAILKKDCLEFKKKFSPFETSIKSELEKINSILLKISVNPSLKKNRYEKIIRFLNSFPGKLTRYLKMSFIFNFQKLGPVADLFKLKEGERWWIHFHRDEIKNIVNLARMVIKRIESLEVVTNDLIDNNVTEISTPNKSMVVGSFTVDQDANYNQRFLNLVKNLRNVLRITDCLPLENLKTKILNNRICFYSILYDRKDYADKLTGITIGTVCKRLLNNISSYTGGRSFYTHNIEDGVKRIKEHTFISYNLEFLFNSRNEDKKIGLVDTNDPGRNLQYPYYLDRSLIKECIEVQLKRGCRIDGLSLKKRKLRFRISEFLMKNGKDFGLIKVKVLLTNDSGVTLFNQEKTLRSLPGRRKILIEISTPKKFMGNCGLKIYVNDIIAQKSTTLCKNLILK